MTQPDTNAFPLGNAEMTASELGLTKREYFAAMAMQTLIGLWCTGGDTHAAKIASQSLEIADVFISELNKTETK